MKISYFCYFKLNFQSLRKKKDPPLEESKSPVLIETSPESSNKSKSYKLIFLKIIFCLTSEDSMIKISAKFNLKEKIGQEKLTNAILQVKYHYKSSKY